jgi:hypothetical protein
MSTKIDRFEFLHVGRNPFGQWAVSYYRDDTRCTRTILDANEKMIGRERKPIGQELITTCEGIIGRKLTSKEVDDVFAIRIS